MPWHRYDSRTFTRISSGRWLNPMGVVLGRGAHPDQFTLQRSASTRTSTSQLKNAVADFRATSTSATIRCNVVHNVACRRPVYHRGLPVRVAPARRIRDGVSSTITSIYGRRLLWKTSHFPSARVTEWHLIANGEMPIYGFAEPRQCRWGSGCYAEAALDVRRWNASAPRVF